VEPVWQILRAEPRRKCVREKKNKREGEGERERDKETAFQVIVCGNTFCERDRQTDRQRERERERAKEHTRVCAHVCVLEREFARERENMSVWVRGRKRTREKGRAGARETERLLFKSLFVGTPFETEREGVSGGERDREGGWRGTEISHAFAALRREPASKNTQGPVRAGEVRFSSAAACGTWRTHRWRGCPRTAARAAMMAALSRQLRHHT